MPLVDGLAGVEEPRWLALLNGGGGASASRLLLTQSACCETLATWSPFSRHLFLDDRPTPWAPAQALTSGLAAARPVLRSPAVITNYVEVCLMA